MSDTRTFTIYGASDDLIETDGIPGCDEFGAWRPEGQLNASFILSGPDGAMRIVAMYAPGDLCGCWAFAPMQVKADVPFPDWPLRVTHHEPRDGIMYSTLLEVEVPEGTTLAREDLSGERIGVDYAGRDREMAYATIRDGEVVEGAIHLGPKYDDNIPENLSRLIVWAREVERVIQAARPEEREEGDDA